jgi:hypothetical protein
MDRAFVCIRSPNIPAGELCTRSDSSGNFAFDAVPEDRSASLIVYDPKSNRDFERKPVEIKAHVKNKVTPPDLPDDPLLRGRLSQGGNGLQGYWILIDGKYSTFSGQNGAYAIFLDTPGQHQIVISAPNGQKVCTQTTRVDRDPTTLNIDLDSCSK